MNDGFEILKMLKQIMYIVKQRVKNECKNVDITGSQGILMGILIHYGEMKVSDISEKLGLSNSTVSGIIDRLEKRGFVERIRDTEDRRVVYVKVTSQAEACLKKYIIELERNFEEALNSANPDEIKKIFDGLTTLKRILDR